MVISGCELSSSVERMASFQRPAFWRVPRNDDTARRSAARPTSNGYHFGGGGGSPGQPIKKVHFIDEVKFQWHLNFKVLTLNLQMFLDTLTSGINICCSPQMYCTVPLPYIHTRDANVF